jgi:flagellar biosynthetic protein FliR
VTSIGSDAVLAAFILFCRIGACLMLMPGFSSDRVPVTVRLFIAISVTLALTPLLSGDIMTQHLADSPVALARVLVSETLTGILIGLLGRIFFAALETIGASIATSIGLSSALGGPVDEAQSLPSVASFIVMAATALFFVTNQHWEVLRALVASYTAMPVSEGFATRFGLIQIAECFGKAFFLALRIGAPFIMFSILINFAIGLANKLTPQIPVFFILTPLVVAAGLFLLYFSSRQLLEVFMAGFSSWLASG